MIAIAGAANSIVSSVARGLATGTNVLLDPEEIRGIFVMGFSDKSLDLTKLDLGDFEQEFYSKLRNPNIKQLILSFKDCHYGVRTNGEVPALAGVLGRVAKALEQGGKKISMCHLPQPLYDYIQSSNHPMIRRLDLHAPLEDAITTALNRAIKKANT